MMSSLLRVNMTDRSLKWEQRPDLRSYGGRHLCVKLATEEIVPTCEPLGRKNKLVFATGLLSGTMASSASRISVGGKSPLTSGIKEANAGGTGSAQLTRCGIKAIVVEGKSQDDGTWILLITNGNARLVQDDGLKYTGTYETARRLKETYGQKAGVMCIGPAGERSLRSACIAVSDPTGELKFAARGGLGAVMGSKGLKAVVVDDSDGKPVELHDKTAFIEQVRNLTAKLANDPKISSVYHRYGTSGIVKAVNAMGAFPTKNFRFGSTEHVDSLSGEKLNELITSRGGEGKLAVPCMAGCVIKCSHVFPDVNGKKIISTLQYENLALIGPNCGFDSLDPVARINWEINDIGMDAIEAGATLGVALDMRLGRFGSEEDCMALLNEIRRGSVLGRLLGNGAEMTGNVLGCERIPAAKGQAFPGYDPRALKGNGVTYAMSTMGADHTAGNCFGARNEVDPLGTEKQGNLSKGLQIKLAALDSIGFCIFARGPLIADSKLLADMVNTCCGTEFDGTSIWGIGEETLKMERAFNLKSGLSPARDRLPEYVYDEALPPTNAVFDLSEEEMQKAVV
jgi:aldehyde:ferredoxin oxidoreductase